MGLLAGRSMQWLLMGEINNRVSLEIDNDLAQRAASRLGTVDPNDSGVALPAYTTLRDATVTL